MDINIKRKTSCIWETTQPIKEREREKESCSSSVSVVCCGSFSRDDSCGTFARILVVAVLPAFPVVAALPMISYGTSFR